MHRHGAWYGASWDFGPRSVFVRWGHRHHYTIEDELRDLEEYQKDLEEELAEIAARIERLKKSSQQEKTAPAAA